MTFEDALDRQKVVTPTNLQILSQVELVEATCVKPVEEGIIQLVIEGQFNLGL
jgi:DNA-binding TFAR19-related protein (PDSD5 family)